MSVNEPGAYREFCFDARLCNLCIDAIKQCDFLQENVTGEVELTLRPYGYTLVGVQSPLDLMKTDFGEYGEVNKAWTADDVKGFTKILGNQMKIYYNVQARNGKAKK